MQEYIEKLRSKPLHVRRTITLVVTSFITLVLILLWLSFWMPGRKADVAASNTAAPGSLMVSNWQGMKDAFSGSFSEMKNQLRF